jgi:polysaccharide export outer membrane protein
MSFLFCIALLSMPLIQSCYSTTAIKGTSVNELNIKRYQTVSRLTPTSEQMEELARMSRLKENKVFTELSGIAEYRIGPLDVLEISSHTGDQVATRTVTVNNRGMISYSFIDDLYVDGLTPSQLDELLTKELSNYAKNPRIGVLVKEFLSKTAMVMGELASLRTGNQAKAASGKIFLSGKTTLLDLVSQSGGYTVDADLRKIKLIRQGKSYRINLLDIVERGDQKQNVIIDDGDAVDIPELPPLGERVYVLGEIAKQGVYRLEDAQDLLAAISLAGKFTSLAKEENTLIVRADKEGERPLVMMADLKSLLREADLSQNIRLEDGDLVYIPRMLIGDINDWIAATMPLLNFILYPARFDATYFADERVLLFGSGGTP